MKYNKITKYEGFEENPFLEKAIEDIEIIKKTQIIRAKERSEVKLIVDEKSGSVEGHTAFMRFIEVDEERFTKLYLSQFSSFWDLSKPAIRVFGYIMNVLQPNKDWFYFSMEDCLKYTNYSHRNSITNALSMLIEVGLIARSNNHIKYFINPLVVFNGSRVTFAKTYIKKKTKLLEYDENSIEKAIKENEEEIYKYI